MADKKLISSSSSCTYNPPSASSSDEISLFLRHIFDRSSPLPSYYSTAATAAAEINGEQHAEQRSFGSQSSLKRMIPFSAACFGTSAVADAAGGGDGCFSGNNAPGTSSATRVSSSSIGASGNETDEYDCESEEGVEAVVDEPPAKSGPPRSSSKRCRAAEVHNLSEKRRRSRINEKMKALQSLIPNSNKTDKASMLDEAIEYLKQLQLQVQMLTMRNGLSLHPLCLPGTTLPLPQIRPVESTNESLINHTNQFATNPNPPDQLINTATSYTLEPSIRNHFGPFPLLTSSMEMSREEGLSLTQQRLSIGHHNTNLTGETGLFDGEETDLKD